MSRPRFESSTSKVLSLGVRIVLDTRFNIGVSVITKALWPFLHIFYQDVNQNIAGLHISIGRGAEGIVDSQRGTMQTALTTLRFVREGNP
jgi:hypothetical protein